MYALVKELDDIKQSQPPADAIALFNTDTVTHTLRHQLIDHCEQLLFQPNVQMAKKSREILWRKGYYDYIAIAKRLKVAAKKSAAAAAPPLNVHAIVEFIRAGIDAYKTLVIRIERDYELDLRNIVDFSLLVPLTDRAAAAESTESSSLQRHKLDVINFALETVHAIILSIGDLHRYQIEFNDDTAGGGGGSGSGCTSGDARHTAARYYLEAFKLNPNIGMAQNQLGTLYSGVNFDLDSTYHYLYALVCAQPFELSEMNVAKIFATNLQYLEAQPVDHDDIDRKIVGSNRFGGGGGSGGATVSLADFLARFKLIADIFFYDKDVTDFNALCHRTLIDLRALMTDKRSQMTGDLLYKLVATMLICAHKLHAATSTRRYSLNAFLVAICSELVDSCIVHLERYLDAHAKQNATFHETYGTYFELFDREVRRSRDNHQQQKMASAVVRPRAAAAAAAPQKSSQVSNDSGSASGIMNGGGHKSSGGAPSGGSSSLSVGTAPKDKEYSSDIKSSAGGGLKVAAKKKPLKMRRRRKKLNSSDTDYGSDDDGTSSTDDDDDDSSDYDLNSDFSSDESSLLDANSSSDEDVADANEPPPSASIEPPPQPPNVDDIKEQLDANYETLVAKMWPEFTMNDDDDADVIIETEENIFDDVNSSGRSSVASSARAMANVTTLPPPTPPPAIEQENVALEMPSEKLRYKRKYTKVDPNILIDFSYYECTIKAIKILFDWLKANADILQNCYSSNPEFVHKIMTLLNHLNIDVFTRKVWFDRDLIRTPFVRADLRELFNIRASIPLAEDVLLKRFPLLAQTQAGYDFELPLVMQIGVFEEAILRILKLVDFGFFICKTKKFRYNFCARSRRFIEVGASNGGAAGMDHRNGGGGGGGRLREKRQSRKERRRGAAAKRRTENGLRGKRVMLRGATGNGYGGGGGGGGFGSNDDMDMVGDEGTTTDGGVAQRVALPKKSYLKNRSLAAASNNKEKDVKVMTSLVAAPTTTTTVRNEGEKNKSELMGRLWLRNEVQTLESKVAKKPATHFTPYLVMDASALADYSTTVKHLVKSKKFVVLIPNAGEQKKLLFFRLYFLKLDKNRSVSKC